MSNKFEFLKSDAEELPGGTIRRANKKTFPVLEGLSLQSLILNPGAVREPHVHPNAAQMDFVVSGSGRVGIVGPGDTQVHEVSAGDVTFIPSGHLHWIENIGQENLHFLLVLANEAADTIELTEMLAAIPSETLAKVNEANKT